MLTFVSILILSALAFFVFKLNASQASHTTTSGANSTVCLHGQPCSNGNSNTLIEMQPDFIAVVQNQLAEGLHLSPNQIKAKLQTSLHITDLAQQQGLSLDQWHTLELNAVKAGMQKLISENKLTQDRANTIQQQWSTNPTSMDTSIELMLGGCPGTSSSSGCPSGPGPIGN